MQKQTMMAGMMAGMSMAMISMLYELFWGVGFWAPPVFISGFFLRSIQAVALPVGFLIIPILVGLVAHMLFSMMLAMPFVRTVRKYHFNKLRAVLFGLSFGAGMFLVMWFIVLPYLNPVMLNLNPYAFAFAHLVWGTTLGMIAVGIKHS